MHVLPSPASSDFREYHHTQQVSVYLSVSQITAQYTIDKRESTAETDSTKPTVSY